MNSCEDTQDKAVSAVVETLNSPYSRTRNFEQFEGKIKTAENSPMDFIESDHNPQQSNLFIIVSNDHNDNYYNHQNEVILSPQLSQEPKKIVLNQVPMVFPYMTPTKNSSFRNQQKPIQGDKPSKPTISIQNQDFNLKRESVQDVVQKKQYVIKTEVSKTGGGGVVVKGQQFTQRSIISYSLYDSPQRGVSSPVTVRGLPGEEELYNMRESMDSTKDELMGCIPLNLYQFGQETNSSRFKRQQNLYAIQNKDKNRVFIGLNTAGSSLPITPLRQQSPFQNRKSTIQHEPSLPLDRETTDKLLKVQNQNIDLFLISGQGQVRGKTPEPPKIPEENVMSTQTTVCNEKDEIRMIARQQVMIAKRQIVAQQLKSPRIVRQCVTREKTEDPKTSTKQTSRREKSRDQNADVYDEAPMFPSRLRSLLGNDPLNDTKKFSVLGQQKGIAQKKFEIVKFKKTMDFDKLDTMQIITPISAQDDRIQTQQSRFREITQDKETSNDFSQLSPLKHSRLKDQEDDTASFQNKIHEIVLSQEVDQVNTLANNSPSGLSKIMSQDKKKLVQKASPFLPNRNKKVPITLKLYYTSSLPKKCESPRNINQMAKGGQRAMQILENKKRSFVIPRLQLTKNMMNADNTLDMSPFMQSSAEKTPENTRRSARSNGSKLARQSIATAPVECSTKRSSKSKSDPPQYLNKDKSRLTTSTFTRFPPPTTTSKFSSLIDSLLANQHSDTISFKQVQFPTKKQPILPQREAHIIRFTHEAPPVSYPLGFSKFHDCQTHRQQLQFLKSEKAKKQNFIDQHKWKLNNRPDQIRAAFNTKLNQERQALVKQFLREDQERRRNFGAIDEQSYTHKKRFSMVGPPQQPQAEGSEIYYLALNSARNSISSNKRDNFKSRLINGITNNYQPENQKNIIAHIQKKPGFKTSLPGIRFSSVEKSPMSIIPVPQSRLLTQTTNMFKKTRNSTIQTRDKVVSRTQSMKSHTSDVGTQRPAINSPQEMSLEIEIPNKKSNETYEEIIAQYQS